MENNHTERIHIKLKQNQQQKKQRRCEGAYVGFQPKPAVEIILVVSKGKTLTWLDDVRIPYQSDDDQISSEVSIEATGLAKERNSLYNGEQNIIS